MSSLVRIKKKKKSITSYPTGNPKSNFPFSSVIFLLLLPRATVPPPHPPPPPPPPATLRASATLNVTCAEPQARVAPPPPPPPPPTGAPGPPTPATRHAPNSSPTSVSGCLDRSSGLGQALSNPPLDVFGMIVKIALKWCYLFSSAFSFRLGTQDCLVSVHLSICSSINRGHVLPS